jgi:branched-chain amino acid transport system substrate-binding protein
MNTKTVLIGIVAVLLVALAGWFISGQSGSTTRAITIGAILPLSGNLAKVGEDVRVALQIAQEDLRAEHPNVTIVYEDDAFDPKKSVDAFNKLTTVDRVDVVIGPLNGTSISAVRSLAAERNVVAFTPWGAGNRIEDFTIKNSVEADEEAKVLAEYAVKTLGLGKVAIVYLKNDFGQMHHEAFTARVTELGGSVVAAESFDATTSDFRTQLLKVKASGAEGLYIVHNGGRVGIIAKQARELGIDAQLFGQYATESSDLISVGGDALEGLIYTFPINDRALTEAQKAFIAKFEARVGGRPQVAAYNAYDIYAMVVKAVSECDGEGVCVRDTIMSSSGFEGVGGTVSFKDGKLIREFYLKQIRDGKFVIVGE